MSDFFRELIGVKCNFETAKGDYKSYTLMDVSNDWIAIDKEGITIYLNLRHVVSITVAEPA